MKNIIKINQANFEREVLNATQPVIVNFWAEWCSQCKMLAPLLNEIATEYAGRVKIARVNVEENPSLAGQHHIESTPTLIYFSNASCRISWSAFRASGRSCQSWKCFPSPPDSECGRPRPQQCSSFESRDIV
ncbi:MAG: thioredoxin domain-containing protein [Limisphaerales bacterium]